METSLSLKSFLDSRVELYNRPEFISTDPIQIPHLFHEKKDVEIAAFFTAMLSWGLRKTIINKSGELLSLMDNKPYRFITSAGEKYMNRFELFCHRTFNATDTLYFIHALRHIYRNYGGLETVFTKGFQESHRTEDALINFRKIFFECNYPLRTQKHVSDVSMGSPAKRLNMFLRWMVRRDKKGVDFGLWYDIDPAWLSVPLDLHSGNTARKLGLLLRKTNDWNAVEELTARLRLFDASDPVKYDFALFGIGAFEGRM